MKPGILLALLATQQIQTYFQRFGYIGIYIYFISVDQVSPIPEEVTLIVIGYFSAHGYVNPFLAGGSSLLAFLTIDIVYYYLTKSGNKFIQRFTKNANSPAMKRYKEKIKTHMPKTLLVLAFIPRVRLLSPVFVALAGAGFKRFIFYNTLGQSLFISVYIGIGFIFNKSISGIIKKMGVYQNILFIVGAAVIVLVSFLVYRNFRSKK